MSEKKDFRNLQQTQLDRGQVLKGSFSEINSALRTVSTNSIIKDVYTNYIQSFDSQGRLVKVDYYQATTPTIDKITFAPDVNGSLAGTFITIEEPISGTINTFYNVINGVGDSPDIGHSQYKIALNENDSAAVVALSYHTVINNIEGFESKKVGILSNSIEVSYNEYGLARAIDVDGTDFTVERLQEGDSKLVGSVEFTYDLEGNLVYNGNIISNMFFDPTSASFQLKSIEVIPPSREQGGTAVALTANTEFEDMISLLCDIKMELKKLNLHHSMITDNEINDDDIE